MTTSLRHPFALGLLLLAGSVPVGAAAFDLTAKAGSTTLPDGTSVKVIGYVAFPDTTVVAPGGPTLIVTQGETVTVNLTNELAETTAIHFQGQEMVPDLLGVPAGGSKTYSFTPTNPGTFLYEAGVLDALPGVPGSQQQTARGLHGALVVRPSVAPPIDATGQAYTSASTAFDDEAVLVLSELDPALNDSPDAGAFDMRDFNPRYFLINGKAYPATDPIPAGAGRRVLLRYVNAGQQQHSMTLLGTQQLLVGKDGSALQYPNARVAETIAPGETLDVIATVPPGVPLGSKLAVFDGSLKLYNGNAPGFGGMLTFLAAGAPAGGGVDVVGPAATAVAIGPVFGGNATLTATITDVASGNSNVAAAEYWIDAAVTPLPMAAVDGTFNSPVENVTATVSVAGLSSGSHTISVRGRDALNNWGPPGQAVLYIAPADTAGPTTSALVLSPSATNGSTAVTITGTGSDQASGNSAVNLAEYRIDTLSGTGVAMTASPGTSNVASLSGTIPTTMFSSLANGNHAVNVRSRDAAGNWGDFATVNLVVDKAIGPVVSGVTPNPSASNGTTGLNSTMQVVRVTAIATDSLSNVVAAEGFIDTVVNPPGSGFVFVATDGTWNSQTESAYGDIPLSTVNALTAGNHTIHVRARDAAGNWSAATGTGTLFIDKTAPTFTGFTRSPPTVLQNQTVTLTVSGATDPLTAGLASGVTVGQYWLDSTAAPGPGALNFTLPSTSFRAPAGGSHTIYVRVRDAAGNWSTVRNASLRVVQAVNDTLTLIATTDSTQTSNQIAPGLLTNDQPTGVNGRTAALASAPVRTGGTGTGTVTLTCPNSLGGAGSPVGGSTICTNGAYRVNLNGVGTGAARAASRRGTYQFTYTESLGGVTTPPATVTITVN